MFRHRRWLLLVVALLVVGLLLSLFLARPAIPAAGSPEIDPHILAEMAAAPDGTAGFLVVFREQADLTAAYAIRDWDERGRCVVDALQATAGRSQARVHAWLEAQGLAYRAFISDNSLYVTADRAILNGLAAFPEVAALRANAVHPVEDIPLAAAAQPEAAIPWNIARVGADQAWQDFGVKGQGIVVATLDTGVEYTHDALFPNYPCGAGPHDDCWYDPTGTYPSAPSDGMGRGTHLTGILAGDDDPALTYNAGMAPDAQWIACKACTDDGSCTDYTLNACADWLLAPNGSPANRPHVIVLAMNSGQKCDGWFLTQIMAWRAAGIYTSARSGSNGPACDTMRAPGSYEGILASGPTDQNDLILSSSSRGPGCGGGIKPEVAAPGAAICSAYPGNTWNCGYSGSSFSTAHSAGLAALLYSANPALIGSAISTTYAITSTALCIEDLQCGGTPCPDGANNVYGWGRIDAYAAVQAVLQTCEPVVAADFAWNPLTPRAGQPATATADAGAYGPTWLNETVDTNGGSGGNTSLALDGAGRPHISYHDWAHNDLRYTWHDGSTWQIETVDDGGEYSSLVLDAQDRPHISYRRSSLMYAWHDGAAWHIEGVASGGTGNSLRLDAAGRPHISFIDGASLRYAWHNGTSWSVETVDGGGTVYDMTALALDSLGRPRISYACNPNLCYAWHDGAAWHTEVVDSEWYTGYDCSLALDSQEQPHISYGGGDPLNLRHAWYDGAWHIETVDAEEDTGKFTSLVLDPADHPRIAYCRYNSSNLKYAWHDGAAWHVETADSPGQVGWGASLGLDSFGNAHISHLDSYDKVLRYAWRAPAASAPISYSWSLGDGMMGDGEIVSHTYDLPGTYEVALTATNCQGSGPVTATHTLHVLPGCGAITTTDFVWTPFTVTAGQPITLSALVPVTPSSWLTESVDVVGRAGFYSSLKLDAQGYPHISYRGGEDVYFTLLYARWDGLGWQVEPVDADGAPGNASSLVLDEWGRPHISYQDHQNDQLQYAHWNGSSWEIQTVVGADVGTRTSIALDNASHPHIAYTGFVFPELKYAYWNGSNWQYQDIGSQQNAYYISLAIGGDDRRHVAFCDGSDLKYAWSAGGAWQIQTVDAPGTVGLYASLALDSAGQPHIAYYDDSNDDLKYARWTGSQWQIEVVDSTGDVGAYASLSLDRYDQPHISYLDYTSVDLKYAHRTGSTWERATVDGGGSVGADTSIAVDADGLAHISYRRYQDAERSDLRHAWLEPAVGLPISCTWNLGDGSSAVGPVLTHTYALAGSYPVVLTATNCLGRGTATQTHTIVVQAPACEPVHGLDFSWLPQAPTAGQVVTFTGSATGTTPISYSWMLEVGSWKEGAVVTHTYGTPGDYTVVLTATNCGTATAGISHTITVQQAPPSCEPVREVDFSWQPFTPTAGLPLTLTAWTPGGGWFTATVDSAGDTGAYAALGLDPAGRPHVAYYDTASTNLRYAHDDGTGWQIITVDSAGDVGSFASLAVDALGRPHLSYYDAGNYDLKYAHYDGTAWQIAAVDSAGSVGRCSSLALDGLGRPHISYYDESDGAIRYAHYDGAWHTQTVDPAVGGVCDTALGLDAAGRPHLAYMVNTYELRYAYLDGTWQYEAIAANGERPDLAVDAAGRPHVSYYASGEVLYAYRDGSGWHGEALESVGWPAVVTSLALDAGGTPHLSYYRGADGALRYGDREAGGWALTTVDGGGDVGVYNSLALDAAGRPRIAYDEWSQRDLRYAWWAAPPAEPITYTWKLDVGSWREGQVITYTYDLPGTHAVVLTATNCATATAAAVHTVTVACPPVTGLHFAWEPVTPTAGQVVTLTAAASSTLPITYSWMLEVGSWQKGQVITHSYTLPGTYTVVLTATNGCDLAQAAQTITVEAPTWRIYLPIVGR